MKELLILIVLLASAVHGQTVDYCLAGADPLTGEVCFPLIAGQNMEVGEVCIGLGSLTFKTTTYKSSTSARDLLVTTNDWVIDVVHIWAGLNLENVPLTNTGNPIPGAFPYVCYPTDSVNECFLEISLEDIYGIGYDPSVPCDDTIWFAVHAGVHRTLESGAVDAQTAWGQGTKFTDRGNWGMYNSVFVHCDCTNNPCIDCATSCETAFAKSADKDVCFLDINNSPSFNRWGWTNGPYSSLVASEHSMDIWAGAAQCDTTKGTLAGQLHVIITTSTITVTYDMLPGFTLQETHLYIGTDLLPKKQQGNTLVYTVAPGQYPYIHNNLISMTSDYYQVDNTFAGKNIFIIAHAVACN